ncbi:MAG: hypothetical protein JXQ29_08420 [Planctomycetes bacterium]|nr:hypothetical protein [Planctomycetota bacterium]
MSTTKIADFYPGTTKRIKLTLTLEGVVEDISTDTLTWRIKRYRDDADASALLEIDADVATEGNVGIAHFQADPADTQLDPGTYWTDIEWQRAAGENYVVVSHQMKILARVSDAAIPAP